MSLSIHLLGTSASRPTVERNVSSVAVHREGETLMFDCGEGTQRQMMRYGISFALEDIFFTHMHADHLLGVIGLIRTMALQGRVERLRLWGPRGSSRVLKRAEGLGFERATFPVEIIEIEAGQRLALADDRDGGDITLDRGARGAGAEKAYAERHSPEYTGFGIARGLANYTIAGVVGTCSATFGTARELCRGLLGSCCLPLTIVSRRSRE